MISPPRYLAKCPECGTKRDPLADECGTCGRAFITDDDGLADGRCRLCHRPVVWVRSRKSGNNIPCNPRIVQIVTADGRTVRGRVSHFATRERRR